MYYKNEEINHILYHNRSSNLVKNFLPQLEIKEVLKQEDILSFCRSIFIENNSIEFTSEELNFNVNDIIFNKEDIENIKLPDIKGTLEYDYLIERGLSDDLIYKYKFSSISNINDKRTLDIIGATTHPILNNILGNGISGGGVLFPLYENDKLTNIAIRRINSTNKMKYSLAIPDISLWGLYDLMEDSEIWICEGLFDRIAMLENGFNNVLSASTPGLSVIHLIKILKKKPSMVNIWSDRDQTGLRHSAIIQKFFSINKIPCEVFVSEEYKDPYDHFKNGLLKDDIYPIKIDSNKIKKFPSNINKNFLDYLKNRDF